MYFKSLGDDNRRKLSGAFQEHRIKQKCTSRLKHVRYQTRCSRNVIYKLFLLQKLKIRSIGLNEASMKHGWSTSYKERINTLLTTDYMSSESSAEESGDDNINRSSLRVKRLQWLKKKYRDDFHHIDAVYYNSHTSGHETN